MLDIQLTMRYLLFTLFIGFGLNTSAQSDQLVKWDFSTRKNNKSTELVLKATMENGWHIYSQNLNGDGPIPTSFEYTLPKGAKKIGDTKEPEPIKHFDENFGMDVLYFNNQVEFVQPISGKIKKDEVVKGKVNYMICNDQMCYPPTDVNFEIKL